MPGKSFFIDTTRCTGCRGCQAACKQWNRNPGTKTIQRGTYQNPPDLSTATFKLVRFSEATDTLGEPNWYFFPDQCRHCLYPLCKEAADRKSEGGDSPRRKNTGRHLQPRGKDIAGRFQGNPRDLPV